MWGRSCERARSLYGMPSAQTNIHDDAARPHSLSLARLTRTVNIATRVEVPLENQKRPDANFYLHNRTIATDVSITHPASKTYCRAAAKALGAAARREKKKRSETTWSWRRQSSWTSSLLSLRHLGVLEKSRSPC